MFTEVENMVGKKIKYYRLKKGWTVEQLAKAIGCTKAAISLYENEEREPNSETIQKIADALEVSWIHFLPDPDMNIKFTHMSFRKKQKASKKDIELIKSEIEKKCTDRIILMDILGLTEQSHFKPKKLSYDNNHVMNALQIRKQIGVSPVGPIPSITSILEDAGIIVLSFDCPEEIDGLNGIVNDIPYIFFNSKNRTIERQRFTIIHELCHLFFNNSETKMDDRETEKYINSLAGHVLIPNLDLVHKFGRTNRNLTTFLRDTVAKKYKIAPSCLVTRLFEEGIITETYYKNFFIFLNRSVGRKQEKSLLDETSDSELPSLFEYQVYLALSEELITASKAAEFLSVPLYDVMQKAQMI